MNIDKHVMHFLVTGIKNIKKRTYRTLLGRNGFLLSRNASVRAATWKLATEAPPENKSSDRYRSSIVFQSTLFCLFLRFSPAR